MTLEQLLALRPHQIVLERVPLEQLLVDSLFYPNCGMDGEIIRSCNERFDHLGICSYVYDDINVTERDFLDGLDEFRPYKVLATVKFDEVQFGFDRPVYYNARYTPFAYWTVFQRLDGFDNRVGPERFSLLFFGGANYVDYEDLYHHFHIIPKAIVGDARLNDANDPYTQAVHRGLTPDLVFYKGNDEDDTFESFGFASMDYDYIEDADVHFGPGGRGSVTIWRQIAHPE